MSNEPFIDKKQTRKVEHARKIAGNNEELYQKLFDESVKECGVIKSKIVDPVVDATILTTLFINHRTLSVANTVTVYMNKLNRTKIQAAPTSLPWRKYLAEIYNIYSKKMSEQTEAGKFNQEVKSGFNLNTIPTIFNMIKTNNENAIVSELTNIINHYTTLKETSVAAEAELINELDMLLFFDGFDQESAEEESAEPEQKTDENNPDNEQEILNTLKESQTRARFIDCMLALSPNKGYPLNSFRIGDSIHVKADPSTPEGLEYLYENNAYNEKTEKVGKTQGVITQNSLNGNKYTITIDLGKNIFTKIETESNSRVSAPSMPAFLQEEEEQRIRSQQIRNVIIILALIITITGLVFFFLF